MYLNLVLEVRQREYFPTVSTPHLRIQLLLKVSRLFHVKNLEACRSNWKESGINQPSCPRRSDHSFRELKDPTKQEKKAL